MADPRTELLQGTLDMLVLKTLQGGALHGYAIVRRLEQTSGELLQVEEGTLYPALHRMERREWIEAEWGLSDSNRRAKYYRLTASGRRALKDELAAWKRIHVAIARVLAAPAKGDNA